MAISSQKLLGGSSSSALAVRSKVINFVPKGESKESKESKGSKEPKSTLIGDLKVINQKTISIDKLLKKQLQLKKKEQSSSRKQTIQKRRKSREGALEKETKNEKKKSGISIPTPPGGGILGAIGNYLFWTIGGNLVLRFLNPKNFQKLTDFVSLISGIGSTIIDFAGKIFNALTSFVEFGYKLYDGTRGLVNTIFGPEGVRAFDYLTTVFSRALTAGLFVLGAVTLLGESQRDDAKGRNNKRDGIRGRKPGRTRTTSSQAARRYARRFGKDAAVKRFGKEGVKSLGGKFGRSGAQNIARKGLAGILGKKGAVLFLKSAKGIFGKIPIVGPIIVAVTSLLAGEGIGKALFKGLGAAIGGFLGTFIPIPVLGTLMGEMLGTYIGDLLHVLFRGGGLNEVGKKLQKDLGKLLSVGKHVFGFLKDGLSRYVTGFLKEHNFEIPSFAGARSAVTTGVKLIPGLFGALKKIGYVDEKKQVTKFPNLLQLFNPLKTIPLAIKSFFPPGSTKAPPASAPLKNPASSLLGGLFSSSGERNTPGSRGNDSPISPTSITSLGSGGGSLKDLTDQDYSDLAYIVSSEAARSTDDEYGVAAAILNRVADPRYPNTIMGVGTAPGQFEAVFTGKAYRDPALAQKLKENQGKIVEALKKLKGRTDFKGQSMLQYMGDTDIMFHNRGNFFHYPEQKGRTDPIPSNVPQQWKKLLGASSGGSFSSSSQSSSGNNNSSGGYSPDIKLGPGSGTGGSKIAGDLGDYLKTELRQGPDFQAVTEHSRHGGVRGQHAVNSYHDSDRAIDIGAWGYEQPKILEAIKKFNEKHGVNPVELIHAGTDPSGHGDHVHAAYAGGGLIKSPGAGSKYNNIDQYKDYGGTTTLAVKKIYIKV